MRVQSILLAAFAALAVVALGLPLLATHLPPLVDYPNHLARAVLLSDPGREVGRFYAIEWAILPNLALDLLLPPLLGVLEPYAAGRVFLFLVLVSNVASVVLYHRAAFGAFSWWPFASALVAYNATFLFGFLNFQIGISAAFAGAALWLWLSPSRPRAALACLAICGAVAFFCHIVAVAFLFLLVGAEEAARLYRRVGADPRRLAIAAVRPAAWLLLALLPALVLYAFSPLSEAAGGRMSWWSIEQRPARLFAPFLNHSAPADILTGLLVFATLAFLIATRRAQIHPGSAVAAVMFFGLFAVVPFSAATSFWIDIRVAVLLGFLIFAGFRPALEPRHSAALAACVGALLLFRTAALAAEWARSDGFLRELREAIAEVPSGARVAAVWARHTGTERPPLPAISIIGYAGYSHLPALLSIDRDAFWPGLFAVRGQQPLALLTPHSGPPALPGGMLPTPAILDADAPQPTPRQLQAHPAWAGWPARFDFVLMIGAPPRPDLAADLPGRLAPVAANRAGAVWRVLRGEEAAAGRAPAGAHAN